MEIPEIIRYNLKKILIGASVVIGIVLLFSILIFKTKSPSLKIENKTFNLYIAKTDKDRQIGLSKYKKISDGKGMLFVFDKAEYYPFWMKGMNFPIDIVYIRGDKVVTVLKDLRAENSDSIIYYPTSPADKVLEINAGLTSKYGIETGDNIETKNL